MRRHPIVVSVRSARSCPKSPLPRVHPPLSPLSLYAALFGPYPSCARSLSSAPPLCLNSRHRLSHSSLPSCDRKRCRQHASARRGYAYSPLRPTLSRSPHPAVSQSDVSGPPHAVHRLKAAESLRESPASPLTPGCTRVAPSFAATAAEVLVCLHRSEARCRQVMHR